MNIVAIIVTWNGDKWIEKCLSSLEQSSIPVSIIVVDNASSDQTVAIIKERFTNVQLVEAGANLGFGQANNIGLRIALQQNAEYVFLLNQDAWIKEDTVSALITIAKKHPEYGILSPFHLDVSEEKLERQFIDFLTPNHNSRIVSDLFFHKPQPVYETTYIHAASWLLSRSCVETVGGFDPLYYHYGEDDDYMQRAKYFSFKIGVVPNSQIVHDGTYKGWGALEWNMNRNLVMEFQHLKRMFPHFRTNVLSFCKKWFDELTSLLLYRKFKKFSFRFKVMWHTLKRMRSIHVSFKKSFTKSAFLN